MRTTLILDDSVAKALKELAYKANKPFKDVVNEVLRAGLNAQRGPKAKPYRVRVVDLGDVAPGINLDKALALADALEDQEIAAKLELRK